MKQLNKFYDEIETINNTLDELIGELEEKRDAIEENAIDRDRDMTDREQEHYHEIDEQINAIACCRDNLEYAMMEIEQYTE